MTDFEKKIISELKQVLEFKEINSDYSQWLQGVSLSTIIERKNNHLSLTARVVVKTSTSDLVDGMDIDFTLEPLMDPNYYENSPNFMGGSMASSQVWLKSHGKLILEQLDNPFEKECFLQVLFAETEYLSAYNNNSELALIIFDILISPPIIRILKTIVCYLGYFSYLKGL